MGVYIQPADLEPFANIDPIKSGAMVEDAEAQAILAAPCLSTLTDAPTDETPEEKGQREVKIAAVKSILRAAILRWEDAGTGAIQTQTSGPFTQSVQTQSRKSMFWPSEIEQLQGICSGGENKAFSVDTIPSSTSHLPWCSLLMGATYCSCGTDIAGFPIYGAF